MFLNFFLKKQILGDQSLENPDFAVCFLWWYLSIFY